MSIKTAGARKSYVIPRIPDRVIEDFKWSSHLRTNLVNFFIIMYFEFPMLEHTHLITDSLQHFTFILPIGYNFRYNNILIHEIKI